MEQLQGTDVRIRLVRGDPAERLEGLVWSQRGLPIFQAILEQWNGREWKPVDVVRD